MSEAAIAAAADAIITARLSLTPLARPSAGIPPRDLPEAYAVRDAVHARLAASRFGARIGWKVGCTTPVMQAYLGIAHPCAAGLFAGTTHRGDARLRHSDFVKVGVECEIAVRLAGDLPHGPFTAESVKGAVGAVMAAIEIVDDRYVDWRTTDTPTLIADDFFAAGCVLGAPVEDPGDPAGLTGVTIINGAEVGRGVGADVMGHPRHDSVRLALEELRFFSHSVEILGVYPAHPFRVESQKAAE